LFNFFGGYFTRHAFSSILVFRAALLSFAKIEINKKFYNNNNNAALHLNAIALMLDERINVSIYGVLRDKIMNIVMMIFAFLQLILAKKTSIFISKNFASQKTNKQTNK
jgi:hypothetical protein